MENKLLIAMVIGIALVIATATTSQAFARPIVSHEHGGNRQSANGGDANGGNGGDANGGNSCNNSCSASSYNH